MKIFLSRVRVGLAWFFISGIAWAQDVPSTPNIFQKGDMNDFVEQANPWGGVDASDNLRGITEGQMAVDDSGRIGYMQMGPGIAVGDLNGDGLLDLVLADSKGFFWFFPNQGTKTEPKFTSGEIMPVWLGSVRKKAFDFSSGPNQDGPLQNYIPRVQLVDFNGDKKLDLIVGTYPGKLFYIPNSGTATQPNFVTPTDLSELQSAPLRTDKLLDCNYLCPFLYNWTGSNRLDLIRGDGTYSANSIFLYTNKGSSAEASFEETDRIKIIPGMGREHLTPFVYDWNNDGKPDIITGERTGQIEAFLNTSLDADHPSFDSGTKIKIAGQDTFGQFTVPALAGLTGNPQVPDLLFSNNSGGVFIAHNTGTPGSPLFAGRAQPVKGVNPFPKILVSKSWALGGWDSFAPYGLRGISEGTPDGVPYEILAVTNAQKEPGFTPPPGVTSKNALKYYVQDRKSVYFPVTYYPKNEGEVCRHCIVSTSGALMKEATRYQISFWVKGSGIRDLKYLLSGREGDPVPQALDYHDNFVTNNVSLGSTWSHVTEEISWQSVYHQKEATIGFGFQFNFLGQGSFYVTDVELHQIP